MLLEMEVLLVMVGLEMATDDGTSVLSCLDQSDATELLRESLDVVCSRKR